MNILHSLKTTALIPLLSMSISCMQAAEAYYQMHSKPSPSQHYHSEEPCFCCTTCNKNFSHRSDYKTHCIRWHPIATFATATYYNETIPPLLDMSRIKPMEEYESDKEPSVGFYCTHCDNIFATSEKYLSHVKENNVTQQFVCSFCKKTTPYAHVLKRHFRTHTREKPFACQTCPKSFSDRSTLRGHIRIHTGEKPYPCLSCNRNFRQMGQLQNHKKTCPCLNIPTATIDLASLTPHTALPAPASSSSIAHAPIFPAQDDDESAMQLPKQVHVIFLSRALEKPIPE